MGETSYFIDVIYHISCLSTFKIYFWQLRMATVRLIATFSLKKRFRLFQTQQWRKQISPANNRPNQHYSPNLIQTLQVLIWWDLTNLYLLWTKMKPCFRNTSTNHSNFSLMNVHTQRFRVILQLTRFPRAQTNKKVHIEGK